MIIEEDVLAAIESELHMATKILNKIDNSKRISRVAVVAVVQGGQYMAWRKRSEHSASPNLVNYGGGFSNHEPGPIHLTPPDFPRAALSFNKSTIAEDLTALLRRSLSP